MRASNIARATVVIVAIAALVTAHAQVDLTGDSVICKSVSAKGQPVSPGQWFPKGTKSLTVWVRALNVEKGTRAEVRWLLKGTTLTSHQVTLTPNKAAWDRYQLGADEALPNGTYQAVVSVDGRPVADAVARVGGKQPESRDVRAILPGDATERSGSSGLSRKPRSTAPVPIAPTVAPSESDEPEVAAAAPTAPVVAPSADIVPAPSATADPVALAVEAPAAPMVPTLTIRPSVSLAESVPPAPVAPPAVGLGPAVSTPGTSITVAAPEPAPAAPAAPAAPVTLMMPRNDPPKSPVIASPPIPAGATTVSSPPAAMLVPTVSAGQPAPTPAPGEPRITYYDAPAAPAAPTPAPTAAGPAAVVETAEEPAPAAASAPEPPKSGSTPLGPRAIPRTGSRPIVARPGETPDATKEPVALAPRSSAAATSSGGQRLFARTRPLTAAVSPAAESPVTLPVAPGSAARATAPTADRLAPKVEPSEQDTEPPKATVMLPKGPNDEPTSVAAEVPLAPTGNGEVPGDSAPTIPVPAPTEAPTVPTVPVAATGQGEEVEPVTPEGPDVPTPPVEPVTPTPVPVDPVTPPTTVAPPVAPRELVLQGPLMADAVAENLPPVALPDNAIKLYRVSLAPINEPAGIQPLWVVKVPDGRLWPPEMPTQFGLHAGENPQVSPADSLLYSDHIDGIVPLYEVPRQEALLHAVRENDGSVLFMNREMYDERRASWQRRPMDWHWMWYVRQVDLEAGDTVAACLTDLKTSPRLPADAVGMATEYLLLLDEQGNRVASQELSGAVTTQVAKSLGESNLGVSADSLTALTSWAAPATGRYQVWAAMTLRSSTAKCLMWHSAH